MIDLNKEIVGDKLSYEELKRKHKRRGKSDRHSMADMSKGIGDFPLKDGNRTMTKPLRKNLFNEPMSVRGIKRIELEEMEKNRNQEAMGKVDDLEDLNDAGDYDD